MITKGCVQKMVILLLHTFVLWATCIYCIIDVYHVTECVPVATEAEENSSVSGVGNV